MTLSRSFRRTLGIASIAALLTAGLVAPPSASAATASPSNITIDCLTGSASALTITGAVGDTFTMTNTASGADSCTLSANPVVSFNQSFIPSGGGSTTFTIVTRGTFVVQTSVPTSVTFTVASSNISPSEPPSPPIFTMSFDPNGGNISSPTTVTGPNGSTYTLPSESDVFREGYKLLGWAFSPNATAPENPNTGPGATVNFASSSMMYAVWAPAVAASLQVSVVGGSLRATSSATLAPFSSTDGIRVSTLSPGRVQLQIVNILVDTPGPALLWSSDAACTIASQTSPVTTISCSAASVELNLSAASVNTFTVVMDATPLTFIGGSGPDKVYAGAGDDTLRGEGGDDILYGGPGKDNIDGGPGNDYIKGETGNDRLLAGTGNDEIVSAEDTPEKDDLVQCGDASDQDILNINPLLDITQNCQGAGFILVPNNVVATGTINARDESIITATWSASAGAAAYQIDYSTNAGVDWTSITRVAAPRLSSWNAGPLRGNLILRVSAVQFNAVSSGIRSNTVTLGGRPGAPTGVYAVGSANAETLENSFRLMWKSVVDATSYDVEYRLCTNQADQSTCSAWTVGTAAASATSADFSVPGPGVYEVRIRALGATDRPSAWVSTSVGVPTGPVRPATSVNAWGSSDSFRVLWTSSTLATKWLKGYRIQMQYNDPQGTVSQWQDVLATSGSKTTTVLSANSLGTKPNDIVRFRVITVPIYGADSRASDPSPRRQQTDSVPAPLDFEATYDAVTDYLTMTWKNPVIAINGGANVGGYDFAYKWPGSNTWTQLGSPLSYDSQNAVFSLENVPRGVFQVRIRSISWPDKSYSDWTIARSVRK